MATQLIPVGSTAADSADIVVSAGIPVAIFLKGPNSDPASAMAVALVQFKASDNTYHPIGKIRGVDASPSAVLDGPGTYRISRVACAAGDAFGVEQG